jgi:hypothetical protein
VVFAVAAFIVGVKPYVRSHLLPIEDVRDQARYVAAHAARNDVILVNLDSNWASPTTGRSGIRRAALTPT